MESNGFQKFRFFSDSFHTIHMNRKKSIEKLVLRRRKNATNLRQHFTTQTMKFEFFHFFVCVGEIHSAPKWSYEEVFGAKKCDYIQNLMYILGATAYFVL